jgi:transcription elongation factor
MVAYSRTMSVKVQRQKHQIIFQPGESISAILPLLEKLPENSVVDVVETSESGITTIVFSGETRLD